MNTISCRSYARFNQFFSLSLNPDQQMKSRAGSGTICAHTGQYVLVLGARMQASELEIPGSNPATTTFSCDLTARCPHLPELLVSHLLDGNDNTSHLLGPFYR